MDRSYPEGKWLLLCISTERTTLAGLPIAGISQSKDAERRDKESASGGEATSEAKLVKNSRKASDSSKRNRWPVNGRQPER
jgi:hypothetical protein